MGATRIAILATAAIAAICIALIVRQLAGHHAAPPAPPAITQIVAAAKPMAQVLVARRDLPAHMEAISAHGIEPIDVVVVNLYPFRQTVTAASAPSFEVRRSQAQPGCLRLCVRGAALRSPPGLLLLLLPPHPPARRPPPHPPPPPPRPCRSRASPHPPPPTQVAVENIDIGGPAMIRAAAKNHESVAVVVDPTDYAELLDALRAGGAAAAALRRRLAWKAYQHTATYDATVAEWLWGQAGEGPAPEMCIPMRLAQGLRYGENPHQPGERAGAGRGWWSRWVALWGGSAGVVGWECCMSGGEGASCGPAPLPACPPAGCARLRARIPELALPNRRPATHAPATHAPTHPPCLAAAAFYTDLSLGEHGLGGVATAVQHHGKEMSYNNYLDADAAYATACDLAAPACVVVKHTNPCGVAAREDLLEAYRLAVRADPVSAFGGIVAFNR